SAIACSTRARVAGSTEGSLLMTRDTVLSDTPAFWATVRIVGLRWLAGSSPIFRLSTLSACRTSRPTLSYFAAEFHQARRGPAPERRTYGVVLQHVSCRHGTDRPRQMHGLSAIDAPIETDTD